MPFFVKPVSPELAEGDDPGFDPPLSLKVVEFQGLGQGKDVLFAIVADHGLLDRLN